MECLVGRASPAWAEGRIMRLLPRVLPAISSAKASHAQIPDMPLRRDTQALRFIAHIPLIQWREKCPSREEKSVCL